MIWGGPPAKVINAAEDSRVCIIMSEAIIEEINQTLAYPRLKRVYEDAGISRQELIEAVLRIGRLVEVKTKVNVVHEDVADNKFLECAFDGKADFLVSGDEHLLKMERYKKIRILSVRQFLRLLGSKFYLAHIRD
jgi:putative PIN family toxin of toxin-antitoxin system